MPKDCAKCGKDTGSNRKKFCSDNCKWWFNSIRKEQEKYLPPVKKRTKEWCHVFVSVGSTISQKGQGKRSGGMIRGSMSANVTFQVCEMRPFTFQSVEHHFSPKDNYPQIPSYILLGDETRMTKDEAMTYLTNQDTAMWAAHLTRVG